MTDVAPVVRSNNVFAQQAMRLGHGESHRVVGPLKPTTDSADTDSGSLPGMPSQERFSTSGAGRR